MNDSMQYAVPQQLVQEKVYSSRVLILNICLKHNAMILKIRISDILLISALSVRYINDIHICCYHKILVC